MLRTQLTELLEVEHPIILAPMGDVAGGALAAAVSNAGGLGLVGAGYADPVWLEEQLSLAGTARVGVGFITFALDERPRTLDVALTRQPPAIQLSFGDPEPYVARIHDAGAMVICQVQTVAEARAAASVGADVIVAQGEDSGGHGRPGRGTFGLVPSVVDAVGPVPVVAAGGIMDGRGLAAALVLGAGGATMGTRFYAASEALSDPTARSRLVQASGDDTVRTSAFDVVRGPAWPEGHDGRALSNALTQAWEREGLEPGELADWKVRYRTARSDDYGVHALWAGDAVDLVGSIVPAAQIVDGTVWEASRLLAGHVVDDPGAR